MYRGEKFEFDCCKFLNENYGNNNIRFVLEGGMNSTKSDIKVLRGNDTLFYVEAKSPVAQSGQFVLIPNEETRQFDFSRRNKSEMNIMVETILDYMNRDYDYFVDAGTAGKKISLNSSVFVNWILQHYDEQNVKYFMSYKDDFVILPIKEFENYFDVSATYRIKKSGSRKPSKSDISIVVNAIRGCYPNAEFSQQGDRLFVVLNETITQNHFILGRYTFSLENRNGYYEIRKLSNTNNLTVVFDIKVIKDQDLGDLAMFKNDLNCKF